MAWEVLRMMSNDERLAPGEVAQVLKSLLAKQIREEALFPMSDPRFSRSLRPVHVQGRFYSPDRSYSSLAEPQTATLPTSSSLGDLLGPRERSFTHADTGRASTLSRSICNSYPDAPYECEIIHTAFNQLYSRLRGTDGVRLTADGSCEIHVNNVKQYLLDCYVNSQTSLAAVLSAFKACKWVDVRAFLSALEAIQQVNYDHSFFNKDELATTKNNLIRQKLLCKGVGSFLQIGRL